jgi:uncharacterized protein (TIGR03118 family)
VNDRIKARVLVTCCILFGSVTAKAATPGNNYRQTNLVSGTPGLGLNLDPALIRPWGLASSPGQQFRVANNQSGNFRSYDAIGRSLIFAGDIASPGGNTTIHARPSGIAANSTGLFAPHGSLASPFLYATQDGTVSGEYADAAGDILATTILAVDSSARGAVYTGIAVLSPSCCAPFLAVADFHSGFVDTFTDSFDQLGVPGTFTDPNLPAGYAPYNLNVVGDQVFVTYALQNGTKTAPMTGDGNGLVDVYDLAGNFVRRFASNGTLNAPWGVVKASSNFGVFSGDILVGNAGDGVINVFDPVSGALVDRLKDGNGNTIINLDLHGMVFGDGAAGDQNTLYIAAGLSGTGTGVLGAIADNAGGSAPDFALTVSPSDATVHQGEDATFAVTATPVANFRGLFTFSCVSPAGASCTVGTTTVDAATGAARVSIGISTSSTAQMSQIAALGLPGAFFMWCSLRSRNWRECNRVVALALRVVVLFALALGLIGVIACGGSKPIAASTQSLPVVVTANSGAISHSTTLTLTVR